MPRVFDNTKIPSSLLVNRRNEPSIVKVFGTRGSIQNRQPSHPVTASNATATTEYSCETVLRWAPLSSTFSVEASDPVEPKIPKRPSLVPYSGPRTF